jgi:hypothetical protein
VRSQIDLHPAIGTLQRGESTSPVDLVGIPGRQTDARYAVDGKVFNDAAHQPGTQPTSAVILLNEHVADPRERGRVGDDTGEGHLLVIGVYGVRARSGDGARSRPLAQ